LRVRSIAGVAPLADGGAEHDERVEARERVGFVADIGDMNEGVICEPEAGVADSVGLLGVELLEHSLDERLVEVGFGNTSPVAHNDGTQNASRVSAADLTQSAKVLKASVRSAMAHSSRRP